MHLISGKARAAQVYPRLFCNAMCAGIAAQKKLDDLGMAARPLMSVEEMSRAAGEHGEENPADALHERLMMDSLLLTTSPETDSNRL